MQQTLHLHVVCDKLHFLNLLFDLQWQSMAITQHTSSPQLTHAHPLKVTLYTNDRESRPTRKESVNDTKLGKK
jgi:hypothetical protein